METLSKGLQIVASPRRQILVQLESRNPPARCRKHRQDGGVISCTGAYVHDRLARPRFEFPHEAGMTARLAVVDPSLLVDRHQGILIEEPDIRIGCLDIATRRSFHVPRARWKEHFSRHSFESPLEPGLPGIAWRPGGLASGGGHATGVKLRNWSTVASIDGMAVPYLYLRSMRLSALEDACANWPCPQTLIGYVRTGPRLAHK